MYSAYAGGRTRRGVMMMCVCVCVLTCSEAYECLFSTVKPGNPPRVDRAQLLGRDTI